MKRSELIAALNAAAPADQDPEVINYVQEEECYGKTNEVKLYKPEDQDDMPYAKSDVPNIPAGGYIVVDGWNM